MEIEDDDLTAEQAEDGYIGEDIVLDMDTTDSGLEIQVDWYVSMNQRDMRITDQD